MVKETATAQADNTDITLHEDYALFLALRKYIARCLTLNHDLNNPLAGILGYAEFLLMDGDNLTQDQKVQIDQILKCAERIKKQVDTLCAEKIALAEEIDLEAALKRFLAEPEKSIAGD